MTWKMQVFIMGEFYGETEVGHMQLQHGRELYTPHNKAYFCTVCGDVWARFVINNGAPKWHVVHVMCERCGSGSIWSDYHAEQHYMNALPLRALIRELRLLFTDEELYFSWWRTREAHASGGYVPEAVDPPITTAEMNNMLAELPEF